MIIKKILKYTLISLIFIILFILITRLTAKNIILLDSIINNEISETRNIELNGYKQKILLEGKKKDSPLLLILHGGPATPIAFGNGYRGYYKKLTDNYLVIEWDQFGCGNNYANYQDLSINNYVAMTSDLVKYLKKEFPNNKLYLFGLSWGTILGTKVVNELSSYIDKYISYGTFTSMEYAFKYTKEETLKFDLTNEERKKIESMLTYSFDDLYELQEIGAKYGFNTQGMNKMDNLLYKQLLRIIISPDYTLKDIYHLLDDDVTKSKIYKELQSINIYNELESINIPTHIIQSKYDNMTPHSMIDTLINKKNNFNYLELENSGHYPIKEDMNIMIDYIINLK